jgi:hypothetical protein
MNKKELELLDFLESATASVKVAGNEELGEVLPSNISEEIITSIEAAYGDETTVVAAMEGLKLDTMRMSTKKELASATRFSDDTPSDAMVVKPMQSGSHPMISSLVAANEDFGGTPVANFKNYSMIVSAAIASAESVINIIYPNVMGDANSAGLIEALEYPVVKSKYLRTDAGASYEDNEGSLSKLVRLRDNPLVADKLKLVPVYSQATQDYLVGDFQFEDNTSGETIISAPIKYGVSLDFGALTQTENSILNGVRNENFTISSDVTLRTMWFTLHNDDDSKVSYHKIDVYDNPTAKWIPGLVGSKNAIVNNFYDDEFVIDTETFQTLSGTASEVITDLDIDGYKIVLAIGATGRGDTLTARLEETVTKFEMVRLIDSDGNEVSESDSKWTDVYDTIARTTHDGYYIDATATNEDLSIEPIELDVRTAYARYDIAYTTPVTIKSSLLNGTNGDRRALSSIREYINVMIAQRGLDAFETFFDRLKSRAATGRLNQFAQSLGNAHKLIDPFYEDRSIALYDTVDSDNTSNLSSNVAAVIINNIKQILNDMVTETGILDAAQTRGSGTPKLVIVTDRKIRDVITKEGISYDNLSVEVVGLDHQILRNKVRFYVTVPGSTGVHGELQWGFRGSVPTPVVEVTVKNNAAIEPAVILQPRVSFHNKLAIGAELTITDWDKVVSSKVFVSTLEATEE